MAGRLGPVNSKLSALDSRLGTVDGKLSALDSRLGTVDGKVGTITGRLDGLDGRLEGVGEMWRESARYEPRMGADQRETLLAEWHRALERSRGWAR